MNEINYTLRTMQIEDYEAVYALWTTIHGIGLRSLDDSEEGIARFLQRNPATSVVAEADGRIVGAILCGHDGRRGCFYHVCVHEDYRKHGIGKAMAVFCMKALQAERINKVSLIAFRRNEIGNAFWKSVGWTFRDDLNYYDFGLNDENITRFNK
ncbi:MAG: GNAT family N-acetyltransferase [Lachnospiraceae bacterium]|nr:GNAT family N-acetyltransferase [Lachnospiraceae bacterium]